MISSKKPLVVIQGWAEEEISRWPEINHEAIRYFAQQLNSQINIYVLEIKDGYCSKRVKLQELGVLRDRADVYVRHIQSVLDRSPSSYSFFMIIDVADEAPEFINCPVFSFQRRIGERNLLLPDLDTLANDFYLNSAWGLPDKILFRDKRDEAVFAGSTTGVVPITWQHLETPFPRLRAARYFRGHPKIKFLLPSIVQVSDPRIEQELRNEGFGQGGTSWNDQLKSKILISMDGNGAALSRNFVALASNSALVKYSSTNEAWYFRHLLSEYHYIKVIDDSEVSKLMCDNLSRYEDIAYQGKEFSENFLTPSLHESYTAQILRQYAANVDTDRSRRGTKAMNNRRLEEIGSRHKTDKSCIEHNFLDFYQEQLTRFEQRSLLLIEIGVYNGSSLRMWGEWFAEGRVVGLDINPNVADLSDIPSHCHIEVGDAADESFLRSIDVKYGQPDIVIDDGSHRWHHQITALHHFWPRIRSGGAFIMEDIHTSFPDLAKEYRGLGTITAYDYILELNRWVVGNRFMSKQEPMNDFIDAQWRTIRSISFFRGTCIINKF